MYIIVAPQRSFNDLSKAAKRSGTNFVRRLQRQSSVVLPRKKTPTSNQLTPQRPIHRGSKAYLDNQNVYLARFFELVIYLHGP